MVLLVVLLLLLTPVMMHPWVNFDEHVDNHGYDDQTDDDHGHNNDICGHISMIYRWYIDDISMIFR